MGFPPCECVKHARRCAAGEQVDCRASSPAHGRADMQRAPSVARERPYADSLVIRTEDSCLIYLMTFVILAACVKLLIVTGSPALSAGLLTIAKVSFALMVNGPAPWLLLMVAIVAPLSFGYFWLLYRFEDTPLWWPVLIGGVVLLA